MQILFELVTSLSGKVGVFAALHDGSIEAWEGDLRLLRLRVDCQYLAEQIDPAFEHFILELRDISHLELDCWTDEISPLVLTTPAEVFSGLPELIAAEVKDDNIQITCYFRDSKLTYVGGTLNLRCGELRLFDAARREMTAEQLSGIAAAYWNDFGK